MNSATGSKNKEDEHRTLEEKTSQLNLSGQAETDEPSDKKGIAKKLLKLNNQAENQSKDDETGENADNKSENGEDSDECQQDGEADQLANDDLWSDYYMYADEEDDDDDRTCPVCGYYEPDGTICQNRANFFDLRDGYDY